MANASDMSDEELEFHYFKLVKLAFCSSIYNLGYQVCICYDCRPPYFSSRLHDFDNNTKLDGLEIFKALTHLLPYEELQDSAKKKIDTYGKTPQEIKEEAKKIEIQYYSGIYGSLFY